MTKNTTWPTGVRTGFAQCSVLALACVSAASFATPAAPAPAPAPTAPPEPVELDNPSIKEQLQNLDLILRASNQKQEEIRKQAIRSNMQLGAFLCAQIQRDDAVLTQLDTFYNDSCTEPNAPQACEAQAAELSEYRQRFADLGHYYASNLVEAVSLYGQTAIEQQIPAMSLLIENNQRLAPLALDFAAHLANQQLYFDTYNTIDTHQWLARCQAPR